MKSIIEKKIKEVKSYEKDSVSNDDGYMHDCVL